ncbi:MAG TPA: MFS transporter [Candidatus Eisenbacteria bacterium]
MSEAPAPPEARSRFRAFLVLWGSQTLSLFGTMVSQFAVNVWLVRDLYPLQTQKPQLALALTATAIASSGPLIFVMPLAGAFADRHDRQRILVGSNTVLALLTAALVALTLAHRLSLPLAVLLLVLYSFASSFHSAAFDSSYGRFVSAADLPRAGGMMMTSFALAQMFAPPLAATLVGLPVLLGGASRLPAWLANGVPFAFAADGVTFVVAAVAAGVLRFPPHPPQPAGVRGSLVDDVRAGFRWILTRPPFLWLIGFGSLANFTFAPLIVLLPLLARDRVAADAALHHMRFEAVLALANTAGGLGGVLGGVLVSVLGIRARRKSMMMAVCLIVLGFGEVIAGLATSVWMLALGMFVGEFLVAPLNTASFTLWQSLTPPHMLARALSTRRFIAQSAFPLGTAVAGWIAVAVEPWIVVLLSGAVLALFSLVQVASPGFRVLEDRMREAAARPD